MPNMWRFRGDSLRSLSVAVTVRQDALVPAVLVVEDERDIRDLLRRYLERAAYSVITAASGSEAMRAIESSAADLVLLDLGLPDIDGLELLRIAKAMGTPVIALTARSAVEDRIRGLEHGADDYVTKPFSPKEVVLRVGAVLARTSSTESTDAPLSFGGGAIEVDESRHEARGNGAPIELTPTEWGLLTALASAPGRVFSRSELVNRVRGYEFAGYERTIDSHVKNLRRKLHDDGTVIETVVGVGYRFGLRRDG